MDQDKTLDEIKAALTDAAETFVEIVYSELSF